MHATLPKVLLAQEIKKRVDEMKDGEEGSAMPYCMAADINDRLWLDPKATVVLNGDKSYFTIRKTKNGYEVIVGEDCPYRWERGEMNNSGVWNHYKLPVSKIEVV